MSTLFIYHPEAIVTIDKTMFYNIHLDQSFVTVFIRDTKHIALVRSCFHRLTTKDYTSFAISHFNDNCNRNTVINQTTESNTGEGRTKKGQYYRTREKFVFILNNISHVSVSQYHQGITMGPVPEHNHHVTMNQVVETSIGAFFHLFVLDHIVSVSKINFISNSPVSSNGCFQNNNAKNGVFKNCIFSINEGSVWFGSNYASQCKYYLVDCYLTGYIPPEHSYVDTSGLIKTNILSTIKIERIREGVCKNGSRDFTNRFARTANILVICVSLLLK